VTDEECTEDQDDEAPCGEYSGAVVTKNVDSNRTLVNVNKYVLSYPSLFYVVHCGTFARNGNVLDLVALNGIDIIELVDNLAEQWLVDGQDHNWFQKLKITRRHEQDDDNFQLLIDVKKIFKAKCFFFQIFNHVYLHGGGF
jgi:hypothetical protein